jgi:trans-aconitate methyltransferase
VGCGTGIYSAWLVERGLIVVGLERDAEMLAAAKAKAPTVRFLQKATRPTTSPCLAPRM